MEPTGSSPCSQEPATSPYPEPDQSIAWPPSHFNGILSFMPKFFMWSLCFRFPTKTLYAPLLSPTKAKDTFFDVYLTSVMFWFNNYPQRSLKYSYKSTMTPEDGR